MELTKLNKSELIELNRDDEKAVVDYIKEIILNRHPIVDNRLDILYPEIGQPETPEMAITFSFYKKDGLDVTRITFMDGTSRAKRGIPEKIQYNELIPIGVIYGLFYFLLKDHDYISNISRSDQFHHFDVSFDVDGRDENMHGISCGRIKVELDLNRYPNSEKLYLYYLNSIVSTFYEALKETGMMKTEFANYCRFVKQSFFDSLSEEELREFIALFESKDLYGVIMSLPDNRFIELFNQYNETSKKKTKTPKLTDN